jgi:predicted Zn finger-like uncharacterized protein
VYTRCEHCQAVLPIRPEDLAQAGGMVRCGSCGRTINALASMFREPPGAGSTPIPADGMPPMLNPLIEQDGLLGGDVPDDPESTGPSAGTAGEDAASSTASPPDFSPEPAPRWARWAWPTVVVVGLLALGLQLFGPESLRVEPDALGLGAAPTIEAGEAIELVSRDLHRHPSLNDAVIVSAVLINRADQPVPWPRIDLRLFDASQQVIGQRLLEPADYLDPSTDPEGTLGPNVRLPVVLEMVVEGSTPSGFSMSFH